MCASFSDYDAVLTEAGDYTSKFFKLRQLFSAIIGNYKSRSQNAVLAYGAKSETCANWPFCWGPVVLVGSAWEHFPQDGREDQGHWVFSLLSAGR